MHKNYLRFYFTFDGRATRSDFLLRYWLPVIIGTVIVRMLHVDVIASVWKVLAFVAGLAINCRRLHDLNLSGWWQVLAYMVSAGVYAAAFLALGVLLFTHSIGSALLAFVLLLCSFGIYFIFLSIKRGTVGPNKYGPDPLQTDFINHTSAGTLS